MKKFFLPFVLFILLFPVFLKTTALANTAVDFYFFYSDTCPHCAKEKIFLDNLEKKYPGVEIKRYDVLGNAENQRLFREVSGKLGISQLAVPLTIVEERHFLGYQDDSTTGKEIESYLKSVLENEVPEEKKEIIKLPFWGEVDLSVLSLPILTIALGTLDGFNPCAMWVLLVLISLLLGLKSRKKIALVGGIFIFAEGLLYFIFMSAWLNVFMAVGYIFIIRIAIGVFGILFGVLRIRDFINWKPGICKVADEKSQAKILARIQNVLKPAALPATILGIFALAFSVNLIEFFCSAGFPAMYTRILSLQNLGAAQYYLYLVFYNFFYMLDDFIVFGFAIFTLSRFNLSDKYNRYSTLVAGFLILILGILLIFRPQWLMFAE